MKDLTVDWKFDPDVSIAIVRGTLQPGSVYDRALQQIRDRIREGRLKFIVHIKERWMSSSGVGMLVVWNNEIQHAGGTMIVVYAPRITCPGLGGQLPFDIVKTVRDARDRLNI